MFPTAALALSLLTYTPDPWTTKDTALEATYFVVNSMDALQTHYITDDPRSYETNPILGRKPSHLAINAMWAGTSALHLGVSYLLPKDLRTIWQCVTIGWEGAYVWGNHVNGVGFKVAW